MLLQDFILESVESKDKSVVARIFNKTTGEIIERTMNHTVFMKLIFGRSIFFNRRKE